MPGRIHSNSDSNGENCNQVLLPKWYIARFTDDKTETPNRGRQHAVGADMMAAWCQVTASKAGSAKF